MRMAQAGLPVPPAFVLPTAWCRRPQPADEPILSRGAGRGYQPAGNRDRPGIWCDASAVARLSSLGGCRVHAGDDGDGVGCRPERGHGRGPDPPDRQSAACLGQLPPAGAGLCGGGGEFADGAVRRAGGSGAQASGGGERAGARSSRPAGSDAGDAGVLPHADRRSLSGRILASNSPTPPRQCSAPGMRRRRPAIAD